MLWRVCGDLVLDFFCLSSVVKITLDRTGLRWRCAIHNERVCGGLENVPAAISRFATLTQDTIPSISSDLSSCY